MQISRTFYLSYRDQRNQPYSHKQTPSVQNIYLITLRLHEYHLVDEFVKKTTSINNYNVLTYITSKLLSFTVLLCRFHQGLPGFKCVCCTVLLQAGLL